MEKQGSGTFSDRDHTRLDRAAAGLSSLSRLLAACTSLLYRGGLLALIVLACVAGFLLVSRLGRHLAGSSADSSHVRYVDTPRVVAAPEPIAWEKVDAAVAEAASKARSHAEEFANAELDAWNAQLVTRIDSDFLPWYFGYWNQQVIGLKALWQGAKYQLAGYVTDGSTASPSQQMAADIQQEFANRVLHPASAQLFLEQLTRKTVDLYLADLRQGLALVQVSYKIPQPQWDRYLEDIAVTAQRTEGGRQVPLSLKAVTASSVGAGALVAASLTRIASRFEVQAAVRTAETAAARLAGGTSARLAGGMGERLAASAGEKMAAKTGAKAAGKTAGRLLGPLAAVAIIAWDVYDHRQTVSQNMPILRGSLVEYLGLLKESLLHDPQGGLAGPIHEIEAGIVQSAMQRQRLAFVPRTP